jgi:hypothetical protein
MSPVLVSDTATANLKESAKLRVVKVNLVRPRAVTETVNGVVNTKMADFMSVGITLNVPTTWASADIKDTRVMASNLLLDALVLAMTDQGAFVW